MKFADAVKQKKKGVMEKFDHYSSIYDFHFERFHNLPRPLRLLEIGVAEGGSLFTWHEYFPTAEICGIDINSQCQQYEEENIKVFIGDQSDAAFLNSVNQAGGPFDIIIDDGGHKMTQQITSFKTLFPLLQDGGFYVIEDLHTSYWPAYFDSGEKTIDVLKELVDGLTFWALEKIRILKDDKYRIISGNRARSYFDKNIRSIHFYSSIVFIEKGQNLEGTTYKT
jgi:hypothetical protein